jgi:hypothetical protein
LSHQGHFERLAGAIFVQNYQIDRTGGRKFEGNLGVNLRSRDKEQWRGYVAEEHLGGRAPQLRRKWNNIGRHRRGRKAAPEDGNNGAASGYRNARGTPQSRAIHQTLRVDHWRLRLRGQQYR